MTLLCIDFTNKDGETETALANSPAEARALILSKVTSLAGIENGMSFAVYTATSLFDDLDSEEAAI